MRLTLDGAYGQNEIWDGISEMNFFPPMRSCISNPAALVLKFWLEKRTIRISKMFYSCIPSRYAFSSLLHWCTECISFGFLPACLAVIRWDFVGVFLLVKSTRWRCFLLVMVLPKRNISFVWTWSGKPWEKKEDRRWKQSAAINPRVEHLHVYTYMHHGIYDGDVFTSITGWIVSQYELLWNVVHVWSEKLH